MSWVIFKREVEMKATMERLRRAARRVVKVACVSAIAGTAALAHAGGGLAAGTSAVQTGVLWLYGLAGAGAGGYLVWVGIQCWSHNADWVKDFLGALVKIAAVGAALVAAGWAFGLFA
ncbi:hypothetical protein WS97_00640 [Burkholderia territorii]|uniref:hypothetical protein n=1 Tax=Burkholderia territorii TaxID=1503055 RepID=UPI00075A8792|nr:hypothetical protein [Burkholderia territorii]KVL25459.1 hypothetical protein WS97_00640 [Burkholderia territorii]